MSLRWRRGTTLDVGAPPPPPPPGTFGPTDGAPAVRSGAGVRTVTNPGGGISFNSSSSLQSAINAQPVGSTFVSSTNTPTWNSEVNAGSRNPTIIFPGTAGQCVINNTGGDINGIISSAGGAFTVRGGTWQNFGTSASGHAIVLANGGLAQDVRATGCFISGIKITGNDSTISHCELFDNGNQGMNVPGGPQNATIEYVNNYGNNTRLLSPGNTGGAGKISGGTTGHYHHNWVHDNLGFGAWWDFNNYAWLIEENVMENNAYAGLFWEASYGAVIRRNFIKNNGGTTAIGGFSTGSVNVVNVRLSSDHADLTDPNGQVTPVDFQKNIVDDDGNRGGSTGQLLLIITFPGGGNLYSANHDIHENQFWLRSTQTQRVGGQDTAGTSPLLWTRDNNFFSNEYRVASTATSYWKWDSGSGSGVAQTYSAWQGFHPGDDIPRVQI